MKFAVSDIIGIFPYVLTCESGFPLQATKILFAEVPNSNCAEKKSLFNLARATKSLTHDYDKENKNEFEYLSLPVEMCCSHCTLPG